MSYPRDLDEMSDEEITKEYLRRRNCRMQHECHYCGKRLDGPGPACKISEHNIPFPAHIATEAVMQQVAATIDSMLPNGRGFVLTIAHTVPGPDGSHGTYVSNLNAADVPEILRGMASYIEGREEARKGT